MSAPAGTSGTARRGAPAGGAQHRRFAVRLARLALRVVLALVTAAVFSAPFALAFYLNYRKQWFGPQLDTATAHFPAKELAQFRDAAALTSAEGAEPIILAYHDIAPHSASQYVVTPAAFAAQMAMLHAAGYHTLTARQLVRYARGGSVPSPSIAITFDDGTRGLWTYADKILHRYSFHGISFLVTSRVGTHQPYYLTWQEVRSMYASGTWDFESHTNDLHHKVLISPRHLGDPLTQPIWLAAKHRKETLPEFLARVHKDLIQSITDIKKIGLPRPALFAYPFSDSLGARPHTAARYADKMIHEMFALAMTNYLSPATPLSHREVAAGGIVSRLEVTSADTAATLFDRLREMASLPVADTSSFDDPARWQAPDGRTPDIALARRSVTFTDGKRWNYAAYAPGATADWVGYEISADIGGLSYRADPSATVSVRVGSAAQLNVSVANHYLEVRLGSVQDRVVALTRDLTAATVHRITVKVAPDSTVVSVDGRMILSRACLASGGCGSGGFALAGFRPDPRRPFARFSHVTVRRLGS
jgi:poly-beta-1,6-N-acetyl-D-glucosamine N-deacetylase